MMANNSAHIMGFKATVVCVSVLCCMTTAFDSTFVRADDQTGHSGNPDPSLVGLWEGPYAWPVVAIHAFLLPTGKVLHYSAPGSMINPKCYVWDPETWEFTPAPVDRPLFCSGHSFMADGRLMVTGGTGPSPPNEFRGIKDTHIFDPFSETWTRVEDMADGRWYPTMVSMPDGKIVVFSGLNELTGEINQDIEIYDPESGGGWQFIAKTNMPLYPRMAALSPKDIFYSGPSPGTAVIDIDNLVAYKQATINFGGRWDGTSVLLPMNPDKVMVIGGHDQVAVTETAEIIYLGVSSPSWSYTQPMNSPRMHANAVILPDGKLVVVGGHSGMHQEDTLPPTTVYEAEIFDPESETWSVMAAMQRPREYHSTAILLPDARVLIAGSNGEFTAEIFSPPYLFLGPRPVVESVQHEIFYTTNFEMQFSSATDSNTVCLVRLSSVTHSINMDQRYVHLTDLTDGAGSVSIPGPSNANLAPPGYYMLFVVNSNGVPSKSAMVRVTNAPPSCCSTPGDADGSGTINVADVTYLIARIFASGSASVCCEEGDADGSGSVNIADVTYLITRIFAGGPAPVCGPEGMGC